MQCEEYCLICRPSSGSSSTSDTKQHYIELLFLLPANKASLLTACFLSLLCSEVNSGFYYKSAAEREKLVAAERKFTDDKVQKVIDLKRKVRKSVKIF